MNRFALPKRLLHASGLLPALLRARGDSFIPMFHGVGGAEMPAGRFESLLNSLGRTFRFAPLSELARSDVAPAGRPRLFLTFDDGLKNNLTVAYPILARLGVPAVWYVCPGLIDRGHWIWTHEMRARLRTLSAAALASLSTECFGESLSGDAFVQRLKSLAQNERLEIEDRVREATPGFQPAASLREACDLMTWDDLRSVDRDLIEIGSHSMTHPMLDSATPEEAEFEIRESRARIESQLGLEAPHFCYPDGRSSELAAAIVRQHYRTSVTTLPRSLPREMTGLHHLPRLGADPLPAEMAWQLFRAPAGSPKDGPHA